MTFQELHYTSVQKGPGGSSGFQFVKLTDGIDPALCRQVEPLLGYEPPRGSPTRPTPEDIAAFPVALSYMLLPQGGAVLCNTTYTGADYSGRYGNFYAHALHLPGGPDDLGPILPIETWRSRSWSTQPGGADRAVAAGEVERGRITDPALCHLALQHGPRIEAFLTDILKSFCDTRKRILLVESDTDTVALWIALACRSLPQALAGRLTFTTYTQRPYLSAYQVTGMPADADFAFSEAEITSQYRVHDTAGRSSPLAQPLPWATAAVALWQAGKPHLFSEAYHGIHTPASGLDSAQVDALTGELAATTVAHDVEVPAAVLSATVTWAETHPSEGTPQFWENMATAISQGRGEVSAASLGRLCRTVSTYRPAAVTAPLLSAYLSALPAAILQDPYLDTSTARWAIGRLAEGPGASETAAAAVRRIMSNAFQPGLGLGRGLMLLELADALEMKDLPARAASQLLAPSLLAGGDGAAAVVRFLTATPNATLREQVLDCLNDEARFDSGPGAPELADAVAGWTRPVDLTSFPLLRAAADIEDARRDGRPIGNADAFCRAVQILRDTDMEDISSYALRIACAGQTPTAGEAREMLICMKQSPGQGTQLNRACLELVRSTTQLDTDILQLAELLRARAEQAEHWMDRRDIALLDLVAATGRLEEAARQPGYAKAENATAVLKLLRPPFPAPQPVREAATAALLAVLLSPQRLEQRSPALRSELQELAACGDEDLIAAYARQAERKLTRTLTESPLLHAGCFTLWWHDGGLLAGTAWLAARDGLVRGLLGATARRMTDQVIAQTVAELDRLHEGLSQEWLHLTRPSRGARPGPLSRARRILRRPKRYPSHGRRGDPQW